MTIKIEAAQRLKVVATKAFLSDADHHIVGNAVAQVLEDIGGRIDDDGVADALDHISGNHKFKKADAILKKANKGYDIVPELVKYLKS